MFKFVKTKKGFTLVELMIVVVIMAILVAVAVPIYSAVTANAKKKTCYSNQKIIMEQLDTMVMNAQDVSYNKDATFSITNSSDKGDIDSEDDVYTEQKIEGLFNAVPYCPVAGNVITVNITKRTGAEQGEPMTPNIKISCSEHAS